MAGRENKAVTQFGNRQSDKIGWYIKNSKRSSTTQIIFNITILQLCPNDSVYVTIFSEVAAVVLYE